MLPPLRPRERQPQPRAAQTTQADGTSTSTAPNPDASVRLTDTDAALARLSAVRKAYLADPFIAPLVPRAHAQQPRPPLINVGTYLRSEALDELVGQWVDRAADGGRGVQIVSLGAGSDTRFWRLAVRSCAVGRSTA